MCEGVMCVDVCTSRVYSACLGDWISWPGSALLLHSSVVSMAIPW